MKKILKYWRKYMRHCWDFSAPPAVIWHQGCNQLFILGEKFSWKFIRWRHRVYSTVVQRFRKRWNILVMYLLLDTKSIVQTRTFCTTLVNKSRQNWPFWNSVGGWITGVKRNFWLAKFLISRHMRMHRVTFYISNTLRKLMIRASGLVFR